MKTRLFFLTSLLSAGLGYSQNEAKKAEGEEMQQRNAQLTLISPLGTNGLDCYKIRNHVSVNIFAGVAGGLNGVEGAGFANVIMKDAIGVQGAGFTNVVLGKVTGAQGAGFANVSLRGVKGVQGSGFSNYSGGDLTGAQLTGFANVNLGNVTGGQFAGFANVSLKNFKGVQFAGFANYNHKDMKGVQGSGYANVNLGRIEGGQFAGFANVAGDVKGAQVSGFFNLAKKVKGLQLGFINVADTVDGASIGFCNIVKHGLHQVEVSADELFYTNVTVRTGTYRFYNLFSAGIGQRPNGTLWQIGYGAGTSFGISDKLRTDVSLSVHHVSSGLLYHATSEFYKAYVGLEYKLAKKCYISAGPTFNVYWGDALQPDFAKSYSGLAPYRLVNETNTSGFNFKAWVGGRIAIRFL